MKEGFFLCRVACGLQISCSGSLNPKPQTALGIPWRRLAVSGRLRKYTYFGETGGRHCRLRVQGLGLGV